MHLFVIKPNTISLDEKGEMRVRKSLPSCEGMVVQTPRFSAAGQIMRNARGKMLQNTKWVPYDAFNYFQAPTVWFETNAGSNNYTDPRSVSAALPNGYFSTHFGKIII